MFEIVIVELGGNDGLRGLPPATSREIPRSVPSRARASGVRVALLFVGMMIPPIHMAALRAGISSEGFTALSKKNEIPLAPSCWTKSRSSPSSCRTTGVIQRQRQGTAPPARQRFGPRLLPQRRCPRQTCGLKPSAKKEGVSKKKQRSSRIRPLLVREINASEYPLARGDGYRAWPGPAAPAAMPTEHGQGDHRRRAGYSLRAVRRVSADEPAVSGRMIESPS